MDSFQQKVNTRPTLGIHVLQESVAQTTCSTCPRHVLAIASQMLSRSLRKAFGASIKGKHLFGCCALLLGEHMCRPILATKRIGDIGCYCEANIIFKFWSSKSNMSLLKYCRVVTRFNVVN